MRVGAVFYGYVALSHRYPCWPSPVTRRTEKGPRDSEARGFLALNCDTCGCLHIDVGYGKFQEVPRPPSML